VGIVSVAHPTVWILRIRTPGDEVRVAHGALAGGGGTFTKEGTAIEKPSMTVEPLRIEGECRSH